MVFQVTLHSGPEGGPADPSVRQPMAPGTFDLMLSFCCARPEPAFEVKPPQVPAGVTPARRQVIRCMRCTTVIVALTWLPEGR